MGDQKSPLALCAYLQQWLTARRRSPRFPRGGAKRRLERSLDFEHHLIVTTPYLSRTLRGLPRLHLPGMAIFPGTRRHLWGPVVAGGQVHFGSVAAIRRVIELVCYVPRTVIQQQTRSIRFDYTLRALLCSGRRNIGAM
jgi:hypothetical protein